MSDHFVLHHLMQFQKLKRVVTRYFDTELSKKVNNNDYNLDRFEKKNRKLASLHL